MKHIFKKTIGKFTFKAPSKLKNKKYDVYNSKSGDYITSFGAKYYQQYKDVIGYYKHLDHNDKDRRKRYYLRHGKAKKYSAKYFAHHFLWSLR